MDSGPDFPWDALKQLAEAMGVKDWVYHESTLITKAAEIIKQADASTISKIIKNGKLF